MSERAEWERQIEEARPRLVLWVAARLGTRLRARIEAEDIVQEILLKAFEGLATFEPKHEHSLLAWLFTIAEHRIADLADHFGAAKRDGEREREIHSRIAASQTSPSMRASREEQKELLWLAMSALSERHREILRLRRFEMLSNEEAGERMGITAKNASVLYVRAVEAMRKVMTGGLGGAERSAVPPE